MLEVEIDGAPLGWIHVEQSPRGVKGYAECKTGEEDEHRRQKG